MIIKRMDSKQKEVEELSSLLTEDITPNQKFLIDRELKAMKKGVHGEEDSAYYIDFYFGASKNWAVIHDLRIEHDKHTAQIDHLLINRFFDIYVLESKNYSYGIKVNQEGEFQAYYGKQTYGIPSPIEQNDRHIFLFDKFLSANEVLPKRMGISIRPKLKSFVLVSPKSLITRPSEKKFNTSTVIKADFLKTKIYEEDDKVNQLSDIFSFGKISFSSTIEETAKKLVSFHKPKRIDFRAKFGLPRQGLLKTQENIEPVKEQKSESSPKFFCIKCRRPVSEKVAKFCWQNKSKFGGKVYCFDCQKSY